MTSILAFQGDITELPVDAIGNAANRAMRGGGGVDGAIHGAAGPQLLQSCIDRFPNGLATGEAGYTTGYDLAAKWVIHTVGPNRHAGETDVNQLQSCYQNSLKVADSLNVKSVAFPLVGAGVYGWSVNDSVQAAISAIQNTPTKVEEIILVGFSNSAFQTILNTFADIGIEINPQ